MLQTEIASPTTTSNTNLPARLLNERKAAARLGVNNQTLRRWRAEGRGPKYLKLIGRYRYREIDLENFIASSVVDPAAAAVSRNRARRRQQRAG